MVYDYSQGWLFDTATGLYWTEQQISTSTYVPTQGAAATYNQLMQLTSDAGLPSGLGPQSTYSVAAADFVAFFTADAPAVVNHQSDTASQYATTALLVYNPPYAAGAFDGWEFEYASQAPLSSDAPLNSSSWAFTSVGLADALGPNLPCDPLVNCGPTVPAFVVSTTPPVPLPAAAWLFLGGLTGLGLFWRKNSAV